MKHMLQNTSSRVAQTSAKVDSAEEYMSGWFPEFNWICLKTDKKLPENNNYLPGGSNDTFIAEPFLKAT